jgi:aminotransferase
MRGRLDRLARLPAQYFSALLAKVTLAATYDGKALVDLGRGNPEAGPPAHVVEALTRAAERPEVHGCSPFPGLTELRIALADQAAPPTALSSTPDHEVAILRAWPAGELGSSSVARRSSSGSCSPIKKHK